MRGQFWCRFQFGVDRNLWVMGGYGILGVWVKRGSTVCSSPWFLIGGKREQLPSEE